MNIKSIEIVTASETKRTSEYKWDEWSIINLGHSSDHNNDD